MSVKNLTKNWKTCFLLNSFIAVMLVFSSLQPCMHTFCAACYSGWMERSSLCPTCRCPVERICKNHILNNLVEAYLIQHPGKLNSVCKRIWCISHISCVCNWCKHKDYCLLSLYMSCFSAVFSDMAVRKQLLTFNLT